MTVQTQVTKVTGNGNGSATTFSFSPLVIFQSTDIEVIVTDSDGVETSVSEGTGASSYSVSVSSYPGTGSITYPEDEVTPLPSGSTITIKRVLTLEQQTDLENQGGYFPEVLETALDKLVMQNLQQQEELDRSLKVPVSYTGSADFTVPTPSASKLIRWDSTGLALENVDISSLDAVVAATDAPEDVSLSAAAVGTGTDYARDDHVHLLPTVSVAKGGTGATTATAALTNLGLSANGKSLVTAADYADMKALLDLEIGTDVQAQDALLQSLADLSSQAAGDILYLSAANTVARLAKGTDDQVLTLASGVPSWADAAGGGWETITSGTLSGGETEIDISFTPANWRRIRFIFDGLRRSDNSAPLYVRTSENGGSSYDAGASDYSWTYMEVTSGSAGVAKAGSNNDNKIQIASANANADGTGESYHEIEIPIPSAPIGTPVRRPLFFRNYYQQVSTSETFNVGGGAREITGDINALRLQVLSGNFAEGGYRVEGMPA